MDNALRREHTTNVNRGAIIQILQILDEKRIPPPSVKEIAEKVGVTEPTIRYHLKNMANDGLVTWEPRKHRSLRLVPVESIGG